jgi:hypothetical protein
MEVCLVVRREFRGGKRYKWFVSSAKLIEHEILVVFCI